MYQLVRLSRCNWDYDQKGFRAYCYQIISRYELRHGMDKKMYIPHGEIQYFDMLMRAQEKDVVKSR